MEGPPTLQLACRESGPVYMDLYRFFWLPPREEAVWLYFGVVYPDPGGGPHCVVVGQAEAIDQTRVSGCVFNRGGSRPDAAEPIRPAPR